MTSYWIFGSRAAAQALAFALALQLSDSPAAGQSLPTILTAVVIQGEGSAGRVRQRAAQDPVIRVLDEKEAPVVGAAVVFTLPTEGASGTFGNGSKTLTIMTDSNGSATAQGLHFNQVPGKVPVHVNVSYKGLTAHTSLTEISEAPEGYKPGGGSHTGRVIAIVAAIAAAGAGGAVYAMRNNGSSTPSGTATGPTAIGITAGTGTVAPPH
jgi:hypothetical protein